MLNVLTTVQFKQAVVAILFAALVLQVCLIAGAVNLIVVHGVLLTAALCVGLTVAFLTLQHSRLFDEHRIQIATCVLLAAVLTLAGVFFNRQSGVLMSSPSMASSLYVGLFYVILLWDIWHLVCTRTLSYLAGTAFAFGILLVLASISIKISGIDPRW